MDPLTDDCVSPQAERHGSQWVDSGGDCKVKLTVSCIAHFLESLNKNFDDVYDQKHTKCYCNSVQRCYVF